jgi:hypothetical protein
MNTLIDHFYKIASLQYRKHPGGTFPHEIKVEYGIVYVSAHNT